MNRGNGTTVALIEVEPNGDGVREESRGRASNQASFVEAVLRRKEHMHRGSRLLLVKLSFDEPLLAHDTWLRDSDDLSTL